MLIKRNSLLATALLLTLGLTPYPTVSQGQTPSQDAPASSSSNSKAQSNDAKDKDSKCTDNGTYVNSKGETVQRPETCSNAPKGAAAQCRDGSYSFSHTRQGTCSHHGGVAKWL